MVTGSSYVAVEYLYNLREVEEFLDFLEILGIIGTLKVFGDSVFQITYKVYSE